LRKWLYCNKKPVGPDADYDANEKHMDLRFKKSSRATRNWHALHAKIQIFRAMRSYLAATDSEDEKKK